MLIGVVLWVWVRRGVGRRAGAKLSEVSVNLPWGMASMKWVPDVCEREAAWKLYVELQTRIAGQGLQAGMGILREAFSSLYSLFPTTREILKEAGPSVGVKAESLGGVAMGVLNRQRGLRAFLTKWHPELLAYESQKPAEQGVKEYEDAWAQGEECRNELAELVEELTTYSEGLAKIAGVELVKGESGENASRGRVEGCSH